MAMLVDSANLANISQRMKRLLLPLKKKFIVCTLIMLASISVVFCTELPILRDKAGPNHAVLLTLVHDRFLFIPHAMGGLLALLIGPVQFSTRLRHKNIQAHRYLGRIYVYSIVVASICSIAIEWHRHLFAVTALKASAWFLCTLFAVTSARNGYLVQHRQWMIRSYALTFTFITLRVPNIWPAYANMPEGDFIFLDVLTTFLAVSLPTVAFDRREITTKRIRATTSSARQPSPAPTASGA